MNNNESLEKYNHLLNGISRELDIPPSKYKIAVERYTAVANWLKDGDYKGSMQEPIIYPQGSFRLGTVIRPIIKGKEADYDIDLVCQLDINKLLTDPQIIKNVVGGRLKENAVYLRLLDDENKRCWTLNYAEQDNIGFHMDILPSVAEDQVFIDNLLQIGVPRHLADQAIAITDRKDDGTYSWSSSNPNGFALWFESINKPMLLKKAAFEKQAIFESNKNLYDKVEDVPDQLIKTPLQRAIQIFKRHRDLRFAGHELEDAKPISMIITTLSAQLYEQEPDLFSTIKNILEKLNVYAQLVEPTSFSKKEDIGSRLIVKMPDGKWLIPNPVNPNENFADRWHEDNHRKARAFFQWVSWVNNDLVQIIQNADFSRTKDLLSHRFGNQIIEKAAQGITGLSAAGSVLIPKKTDPIAIKQPNKPWGY